MAMNIALSIMSSDEKNSPPASKDAADSVVEYLFTTVEKRNRSEMNEAISNRPEHNVADCNGANDAVNISRYCYTWVLVILLHRSLNLLSRLFTLG